MLDFAIVGAGMVGCASALALNKRGYKVEVFESRTDPRIGELSAKDVGRSINLALSARGIRALQDIDQEIAQRVCRHFVPMYGRMIHSKIGEQTRVAYGVTGNESNQSISRSKLNEILLDEVDKAGIPIHFEHKLSQVSFPSPTSTILEFEMPERSVEAESVIGCDGTWSKVRSSLQRLEDSRFNMETVDTYYIEMTIPVGPNGPLLDMNHLHIWPRKAFMLIALPNVDGSFTGTLFAPSKLLNELTSYRDFDSWFAVNFPDAYPLVDQNRGLLRKYYDAPRGRLVSIKTYPYNHGSQAIILGDSAHSMVPFYGQGLNCGLEDVRVLMNYLDSYTSSPRQVAFSAYSRDRVDDLNAINDLSMQNYIEMRDSVSTRSFALRKYIDNLLNKWFGDRWLPLYTMVSFRSDLPYSKVVAIEARQAKILRYIVKILTWSALLAVILLIRAWS